MKITAVMSKADIERACIERLERDGYRVLGDGELQVYEPVDGWSEAMEAVQFTAEVEANPQPSFPRYQPGRWDMPWPLTGGPFYGPGTNPPIYRAAYSTGLMARDEVLDELAEAVEAVQKGATNG